MDLDMCLFEVNWFFFFKFYDSSSSTKLKLEKQEQSSYLSLMIIIRSTFDAICGGVPSCESTKEFLDAIRQKFKESDKAEI